jgi:ATP-dependent DNA helicase RecG
MDKFFENDLQFIKGIGPKLAEALSGLLGGRRVLDFVLHRPNNLKFRPSVKFISEGTVGEIITIPLKTTSVKKGSFFKGRRIPLRFIAVDAAGDPITIHFFHANFADYWSKQLPINEWRIVSGKLEANGKTFIINHPDFIVETEAAAKIPEFQAIYPLTDGITQKIMQNLRDVIMPNLPRVSEWLSSDMVAASEGIGCSDALRAAHYPETFDDTAPTSKHNCRLAFDELFAHQLAIVLTRVKTLAEPGICMVGTGELVDKLRANLPFKLTDAQARVIDEIFSDMANDKQMRRLVQGDVGSGKTIVSLFAMLRSVESGFQAALLAPTDTLAQQHYAKLKPMLEVLGVHCDILTGRDTGSIRHEKLVSLKSGRTKILIGTHAVFQEKVEYKNLGLVVIDEQHRFGVEQRLSLTQKGQNPDMLALSATPIPRTLSMTIYGDMNVSVIEQKPVGRKAIKTSKLGLSKLNELLEHLKAQIARGAHIFWVCPLVEESKTSDLMAAESRYDALVEVFGKDAVGLVHGKMPKEERDRIMVKFADKNSDMKILVATTVIEVGIDVPQATIMIIEDAYRFGLSALHQLRGRVGRGSDQSYCILLMGRSITPEGIERLNILCQTDNGFEIAEHDLMMRGVGEMLGVKQSGFINYKFVDWKAHKSFFKLAAVAAKDLVNEDPRLESARGLAARQVLEFFGRVEAMRFIDG